MLENLKNYEKSQSPDSIYNPHFPMPHRPPTYLIDERAAWEAWSPVQQFLIEKLMAASEAHDNWHMKKFALLVERWKSEVSPFVSSVTQICTSPAYQEIIGMGPSVIPLILRKLQQKVDHWYWALHAITGTDPVDPNSKGNLEKMRDDWLRWGREIGHIR